MRYAAHKQPSLAGKPIFIVVDYEGERTPQARFPVVFTAKTEKAAKKWINDNDV